MTVDFSGVFLTVKNHGGMYTVCTEGELFYAPMYRDGSVNLEEFDIVDFWDSEVDVEELEEIQSALIDMMTRAGLYFKQPVGRPRTGTGHSRIASGCPILCSYSTQDTHT